MRGKSSPLAEAGNPYLTTDNIQIMRARVVQSEPDTRWPYMSTGCPYNGCPHGYSRHGRRNGGPQIAANASLAAADFTIIHNTIDYNIFQHITIYCKMLPDNATYYMSRRTSSSRSWASCSCRRASSGSRRVIRSFSVQQP